MAEPDNEDVADFDPGEMEALLAEGEQSGPALDGEEVLREFRELRETSGRDREELRMA